MWFVYILLCDDKFLYTGLTSDIDNRLRQHQKHLTKSTKRFVDIKLVYTEKLTNKFDAARREREIKGWSRQKKLDLINLSLH